MHQLRQPSKSFALIAAADYNETGATKLWPAISRIIAWGLAAGILDSLLVFARMRAAPQSLLLDIITFLLFPVFALGLTLITSVLYHIACQMMGGYAPWRASFRAIASMAWTAPLDVLALVTAYAAVPLAFYRLFLLSEAARVLHGLSRARAIGAAFILGGISFFLLTVIATVLTVLIGAQPA